MHAISTETVFDGNRIVFNCTSSNQGRKHQEARDFKKDTTDQWVGQDYLNMPGLYVTYPGSGWTDLTDES